MARGNIRKRSSNSYEISWEDERNSIGRRVRRYETVKGTRKDAESKLNEILASRDRGTFVEPTRITFSELLTEWLDSYVTMNCRHSTQVSYRSLVTNRIGPALGSILLTKLTGRHIQTFIAQVSAGGRLDGKGKLRRRTPELVHQVIHGALEYAIRMELLGRNVARAVVLSPPEPASFKILEIRDIPAFIRAARETDYFVLYMTGLLTGVRLGELLGLRWTDLKNNMTELSIVRSLYKRGGVCEFLETKTKYGRRLIALPPMLVELLRRHRV
ncbi:hypothetical protein ACFLT4_07475, partial [Chloroflexota bacterium]